MDSLTREEPQRQPLSTQELSEQLISQRQPAASSVRPSTQELSERLIAARTKAAEGQDASQYNALGLPKQAVDPDSLSSGVGRSVDNLQAAYGGSIEMLGEIFDHQPTKDFGSEMRDEQQRQAALYGTPSAPTSIKDVIESGEMGDLAPYLKEMGVSSIAPLGVIASGGWAGAKVTPGGPVNKAIGSLVGSYLAAFGINSGTLQNAMKEVDPEVESPWTAFMGGTINSALDAGGATYLLRPWIQSMGKEAVVKGLVKRNLTREVAEAAVKTALLESSLGVTQSLVHDVGVSLGTGTDLTEDLVYNAIDGALGGGILGGTLGGGGRGVDVASHNQKVAGSGHKSKEQLLEEMGEPTTPEEVAAFDKLLEKVEKSREKSGKSQSLAGRLWSGFGGSSVDKLTGLSNISPSARKIKELFRADMSGKTASGTSLFESAGLMVGKWRTDSNQIFRNKSEKQLSELFADVSRKGGPLTEDGVRLRRVLDDVHDTATGRGGLDTIGYVEGHLPVRLDRDLVMKNRGQFIDELVIRGRDRVEANKALDEWLQKTDPRVEQDTFPKINRDVTVDEVTGEVSISEPARLNPDDPHSKRYRMGQGTRTPEFGHLEKSRAFADLPQDVLNKYAIEQTGKQKKAAVLDYFEGAAHRIASSEVFGPNGDKLNALVAQTIAEAQQQGRKVEKMEVDRIYDIYDAYHGLHGRIKDARVRKIQSLAGAVVTVATLPLSAFSSLTEFVVPAIRGDIQAAVASVAPTLSQYAKDFASTILKDVPPSKWALVASEANISFSAATSVASERLGANMFSRSAATWTRGFFIANGLSLVTHMSRVYAAKTGDFIFNRNLRELANGLPLDSAVGRNRVAQLRSMGIDIRSTADAKALYTPHGVSQNKAAREARVLAIRRFSDQSTLNPNLGSTPLWQNEGRFQSVAMLKRYPAAFGNVVLPQLARRLSPDYAGSYSRSATGAVGSTFLLGLLIGVGYIQDELKQIVKGGEDTRTEEQRFADVLALSAMNLQTSFILDAFYNAPRYGENPVASAAGPMVGSVSDGIGAIGATIQSFADEPTAGHAVKYLFKQTPARVFQGARDWVADVAEEI